MSFVAAVLVTLAVCAFLWTVYSLCFHALSQYPGPVANRICVIPKVYHLVSGDLPYYVADLHRRYGRVVRLGPNELAFTDPRAWKDIYTRKLSEGRYELPHDMAFYKPTSPPHPSMLTSDREEHDNIRKLLNPGFSDRAINIQEPTITHYVDLLIQRLQETCVDENGHPNVINMRDWIAYCTFDLIGDLAFGSDFGCLKNGTYHPWVALIAGTVQDLAMLYALRLLGIVRPVRYAMVKLGVGTNALRTHVEHMKLKTEQRIKLGGEREDFLNGLIQAGMSHERVRENGSLLIVAGSETTATLLTAVLFFLAKHQTVLERLQQQVRSQFASTSEMTVGSVSRLPYLLAVLKEGLRCCPPAAGSALRQVPRGGATIAGNMVPEGSVVGVWQWAMYHDPEHFHDPYRFNPDRFLDTANPEKSTFGKDDSVAAFNPFLLGPRNCIGQNLAYAEMRLILARLLWRFDMQLCKDSEQWMDKQKNYILWKKPDLNMYITPRKVTERL